MKLKTALFALGLSGVVIGAVAQTASAPQQAPEPSAPWCMMEGGHGHHHQMKGHRKGEMGARMAQRQKELHDKLKLTPDQEVAWTAMHKSMKPSDRPAQPDMAEMEKLKAPDRMEKMMATRKQHQVEQQAAMEERLAALKSFYGKLTPEQQKTFDQETLTHWKMHGHRASPAATPKAK